MKQSPAAMATTLSANFRAWRHYQYHAASTALGFSASSHYDFDHFCHHTAAAEEQAGVAVAVVRKPSATRLFSTTIAKESLVAEHKAVASSSSSSSASSSGSSSTAFASSGEAKKSSSNNNNKKSADASLEVVALGLSHHNAKVEVREQLAVPEDQWHCVAQQLASLPSIHEAAVLSTCNRFELYLSGTNVYEVMRDAVQFLLQRAQLRHHEKCRLAVRFLLAYYTVYTTYI